MWATTAVERTSRLPGQPGVGCSATSTRANNPERRV
ncbi:hypothetical protein [Streptomyces sp. NPDC052727]